MAGSQSPLLALYFTPIPSTTSTLCRMLMSRLTLPALPSSRCVVRLALIAGAGSKSSTMQSRRLMLTCGGASEVGSRH